MTTTQLSATATDILALLRSHVEGSTETDDLGRTWRSVYLDNARPAGMSAHAFAGYLLALKAAGLYRELDGDAFGDVLIQGPETYDAREVAESMIALRGFEGAIARCHQHLAKKIQPYWPEFWQEVLKLVTAAKQRGNVQNAE